MDIQIEKEMVAYFIMKNRKKRTQWELESTRKRDEGISRFINGTYLDSKLFIPIQDRNSKNVCLLYTSIPLKLIQILCRLSFL